MDDEGLDHIGNNLASTLKTVDLRDCPALTPNGIVSVIERCTNLAVLRLRSPVVNDECVYAAARHLPRLRTLDLQKCVNVTSAGVRALAAGDADGEGSVCRDGLRILNVLGLSRISKEDVKWLLTQLPNLEARTDFDVRPYEQDFTQT